MKRRGQGVRRTAHKSSPNTTINTVLFLIAIILDALIKIGSSFLWPVRWLIKLIVLLKQKAQKSSVQIKRLVTKKRQTVNLKIKKYTFLVKDFITRIVIAHIAFTRGLAISSKLRLRSLSRAKRGIFLAMTSRIRFKPILRKKTLKKKGKIYKRPTPYARAKYLFVGIILTLVIVVWPLIFYFWLKELPNPTTLSTRDIPATTKIYDRNGTLLYQIYKQENRTLVKLSDIPDYLKEATISMEDKDYYRHHGINWKGIARAALVNLSAKNPNGRPLQGGSSITQQLIKSALLTSDPTIARKVKEIALAIWAERIYTKEQILEMYFNQVPYGGTAWGIEAASETYFNKKVSDLDLAESSLLAGLPAAPTFYSPFGARPEQARQRQQEVLRRMVEDGYISREQADNSQKEQLHFAEQTTKINAPHFVMYVRELLAKKYGERMVEQGGLNVITSLDLSVQEMAQKEVTEQVTGLQNLQVGNGAALVTNPQTGEILAMVGSRDYFDLKHDGNVNVTLALRQPGSSIKPVMYAAALEHGFTPASIIDDSPVVYQSFGQPPYAPVNYDGKFHGKVTLRTALASSLNVPAVKVLNVIGVHTMIEMGKKMGISTWEEESRFGLSLTLGGGEVTMLDMAKAYGVLATGGKRVALKPILKVTDYRGKVLEEVKQNEGVVVLPAEIPYILSNILADNNARAMAFGFNSGLTIPGKTVSVKTGTTNDKRDNWTLGYTPSYLVGVWVGNNDNSPMNPYLTSGITGAAPIWHNIMANLIKDKTSEPITKNNNIVAIQVCSWNGMLPCEGCPTITEYFVSGTEPKTHCEKITPTPTATP